MSLLRTAIGSTLLRAPPRLMDLTARYLLVFWFSHGQNLLTAHNRRFPPLLNSGSVTAFIRHNGTFTPTRSLPTLSEFSLDGKVVLVSGGVGELGIVQCEALMGAGAIGV
jgi:hypothetical protein